MIMPCLAQPFLEPKYQCNPCFAAGFLNIFWLVFVSGSSGLAVQKEAGSLDTALRENRFVRWKSGRRR